ncbi:DUF721 domain-containing protein [Patiriisocius hiemis]|uniref:DUF721 domain-containing protein n=1 Tax=Patiriisocius hiemis TaxID=3075604 RepID=A0ABU2Y986_9FLAO|nr:DUF721 domain-containing protein [Constantimarinum sp. W242]MDT0554735.1 DUF721 domain-containing protein [Constantimarinum sp. W242]
MSKRNHEPNPMGDILKDFISNNKLQKGLDKVAINEVWHEVMGPGVSGYTTQVKLDGSTLYIQLSSSVLREELSYGKEKIVKLLNETLGKQLITKLVLR